MRSCGNCFWSFSPADEEALREEYHGEDYDLDENNPRAGDCCLGVDHNNKYYCSSHSYSELCEDCEEYENLGISEYISIDLYNAIKAALYNGLLENAYSGYEDYMISFLIRDLCGGGISFDEETNRYYNVINGDVIDLTKQTIERSMPINIGLWDLLQMYKKFLINVRNNMCEYSFEKINGDIRIQKHKEYLDGLCMFSTFEIDDYYVEDDVEYVKFDLAAQNTGNIFTYKHNLITDEYELCSVPCLYTWKGNEANFTREVLDSIFEIARDNKEDIKTIKKLMSINSHK